ncbi:creatininase family protein [Nonomuraea sp. NBC_01738]|uniref:creatininase family protein n=1 Tax=Nonomuraea sp. NBC_01738 TaxID=2976003 RepID=UPI002E114ED7|nr:creatininase family protein [Nonomuraea sp. NBC_01738]
MHLWAELTRERLGALLPEALVVLPVGATEQHGPHLPTGTDTLLAATVAERACRAAARCERPLILAPAVATGASDHHLTFGGTLSLRPETLLAVLLDLARSVAGCGGRRLVLVNGHGGNRGVCTDAASAASVRFGLSTAYANYWELIGGDDPLVPGHAGAFETSAVLALRPELVGERPEREAPPLPEVPGVVVQPESFWRDVDGYTDEPSRATAARGEKWLDAAVAGLAGRLEVLGRVL